MLVIFATFGVVFIPVMGFILARMEKENVSGWTWFYESALLLVVAIGGLFLIRRKPLGLLLVAMPVFQFLIEENFLASLIYLAAELLIFGMPLALAKLEKSSSQSE